MSKIQWTDVTDNPIYIKRPDGSNGGHWCQKKSEGCAGCYAEDINQSDFFSFASHLSYTGEPPEGLQFDESIVQAWVRQRSSKKHFVCSMTDLFGEWVPREWQYKTFDAAMAAPKQVIQLLTKRPDIALKAASEWRIDRGLVNLPSNLWMGVTVENQRVAKERRISWAEMSLMANVTWVSYEPALENVDWSGWDFIDWMVIGGMSGSKATPFDLQWARSAIDYCRSNGIAPFFKQGGAKTMMNGNPFKTVDRKAGDINEFPEDLRVREFPQQ